MDIDLQHRYHAVLTDVVNDNTEQARAVISNILATKMAEKLRAYNSQLSQLPPLQPPPAE